MDRGKYLSEEQWTSVVNVLERSSWTSERRVDIEPIFAVLESLPYAWQRFPCGEAAIANLHGIRIERDLIRWDSIVFYSKQIHTGYFADCWREQRGRQILPLGRQDLSEILIDDQGFMYKDFEGHIGLMGRDLQEGLYNLMFGWDMGRFRIDCEEPDEIFELYQNGAFAPQIPSKIKA